MSVVFIEGFDHISSGQTLTYKGWQTGFINAVAGRISGQGMRLQGGAAQHALPASYNSAIFGAALIFQATNLNDNVMVLMNGGSIVAAVRLVTVGASNVFRIVNSAGTTLATGTTPIVGGIWYYLELKALASATVGTVELRLNGLGTAECSATGVNTGALDTNKIQISGTNGQTWFDDMYVVDTGSGSAPTNTFLGDVRVETLYPTSNGANTAWTGVFTDADDPATVDDDTTFISSSTPGDKETYGLGDLVTTAGSVFAVQVNVVARKDDAGVRTIAPVTRVGGTDFDGTTTPGLATSYQGYQQLYERLDPSGAAWTIASVNAMEAGVKEVA